VSKHRFRLDLPNLLLALLSAAFLVLLFPRFNVTWLAPVALTPLLIALTREGRAPRRFLIGYIAGVIYWFGVCYWIQFVLSFHGGLGNPLGWAVFLLFCLVKALHMGVFGLAAGYVVRGWWAVPAIAALWVAVEITHGSLGFAWLALGNAGIDMSLPMRLAPYAGVYGVSFVFAVMSATLALLILRRPRRHLLWILSLPLLLVLPRLPDAQAGSREAVLVQPNISEAEDWTSESVDQMQRRLAMLTMHAALAPARTKPDLLVWPEVPAPIYYEDARFRELAQNLARVTQTYFLFGLVAHTPDGAPLNSALLLSPSGDSISRYDKIHLVPFGEFVPWPFGFANKISTEVGDFRAGNKVVVSQAGDHKIATFICYESVFPGLVRRFVADGSEVLFNLSNDGWFGKSSAREQHLRIVRMRAAENRRWILRSTNDGITAAIDPAGRVVERFPSFVEAAARAHFSYGQDLTSYTRHGDWFAVICAILVLVCALAQVSQRNP
jgi:apolipoprotein N-acyltransferase